MKNIIIGALIFILLLVVFAKYSWSGFTSENEYVDLVYKMLSENQLASEIVKALVDKGVEIGKIPTYMSLAQMKLSAEKSPASTTEAPPVAETMQAPASA